MIHFSAMPVRTKLALSFGLLVALLCAVVATAVYRIDAINTAITHILDDRYAKVRLASEITRGVNAEARFLRNAIIGTQDAAEVASLRSRTQAARERARQAAARLAALVSDPPERALFDAVQLRGAAYAEGTRAVWGLIDDGKPAEAGTYLLERLRKEQNTYFESIDALADQQSARMESEGAAAQAVGADAVRFTLALAALAVVVSVGLAVAITRALVRQLGAEPADLVSATRAIAAGDLAAPIALRPGDRHSVLSAMLGMRDRLADLVGQVRAGSQAIAGGSASIAAGSADLSRRTERQAGNLEETAASMEQIGGAVRQNAETAAEAARIAEAASGAAHHGHGLVGRVTATMDGIATSSRRIGDIIGVIDSIAFQTNILALNAAVEAARAGAEGRGFAVVATEVRNLAKRSADAAHEIKGLIASSMEKVEAGTREVNDARASMDAIVAQVASVSSLIGEISSSTAEQAAGIGQVGEAMAALDQVTQQNAALVEQSTTAADQLRAQSAQLARLVSVFRLEPAPARLAAGAASALALQSRPMLPG